MKNWIYILLLFLLSTIYSCSEKKIEVGHIETRAQLDSIIALLPTDSVKVDSLVHRTLNISLQGNLSIFGTPTRKVSFTLINEEIEEINFYDIPQGTLTLLNNIESEYGLGVHEMPSFSWDLSNRKITLTPQNNHFFRLVQPLHIHDSIGANISMTYYSFEENKITGIAKEHKPNSDFKSYKLSPHIYSSLKYKLWINDFPIEDEDMRLNEMIPARGKQSLTIEFLPSSDRIQEMRNFLVEERGDMFIQIREYNDKGQKIIKLPITSEMLVIGKKNVITFDLLNVTYRLDYIEGKDLRTVDGLKEKIYALYKSLQNAYETKNKAKLINSIYPLEKQSALALNRNEKELQEVWSFEKSLMEDNEGIDLMSIDDLKLDFAYNGKLARLIPNVAKQYEYALAAYKPEYEPISLAHYVYLDNTNNLNFAIE